MEILIVIAGIVAVYLFIRKYKSFKPDHEYKNKIVSGFRGAGFFRQANAVEVILGQKTSLSEQIWLSINESRINGEAIEEACQKIDAILLENGI